MKYFHGLLAAFAFVLLFSSGVVAQDPALLEQLHKVEAEGTTVRVTTATSELDGRIAFINDSTFSIRNQHVFVQDVTALHRKKGSSTGAKVGAVVGALGIGALGGMAFLLCGTDCRSSRGVMLGAGGVVAGGVLGGLIGNAIAGKNTVLEPLWVRPDR